MDGDRWTASSLGLQSTILHKEPHFVQKNNDIFATFLILFTLRFDDFVKYMMFDDFLH